MRPKFLREVVQPPVPEPAERRTFLMIEVLHHLIENGGYYLEWYDQAQTQPDQSETA